VVPPTDEVLPAFLACQDEVLQVIAAAKGLPLDRMKITSPFDHRVRYSVWSSFCANAAHQRRHLWQAERVADVLLL
jgi:DinB superfamily